MTEKEVFCFVFFFLHNHVFKILSFRMCIFYHRPIFILLLLIKYVTIYVGRSTFHWITSGCYIFVIVNHGMIAWEFEDSHTFFDTLLIKRWGWGGSHVNVPFFWIWKCPLFWLSQKGFISGLQHYDTGSFHSCLMSWLMFHV